MRESSKIVHEWNGHLEIFSCPQGLENSRQGLMAFRFTGTSS